MVLTSSQAVNISSNAHREYKKGNAIKSAHCFSNRCARAWKGSRFFFYPIYWKHPP